MSKYKDFNLSFYKKANPIDGSIGSICKSDRDNNPYANLQFIQRLANNELEYFIESITLAQQNLTYDPDFIYTDGTDGEDIVFIKPIFLIHNTLTIHMNDLKQLMEEWLAFKRT